MTTVNTANTNVANQLSKLNANKEEEKKVPTELFQHYKSPRVAMRAVTTSGVVIKFVNYELLTQDPEVIEYLDAEIKRNGLPGITKGAPLSLEDRNPEKAMERRLREEIEARVAKEVEAGTFGQVKDYGQTANASSLGAITSKQTAS